MAKLKDIIGEELFKQLSTDKQKEYENKDYEDVSGGAYVTKAKFDQVNDQAKEYKNQVRERDKQLNVLQEKAKDNEVLTKELEIMKTTNANLTKEYEEKAYRSQLDMAIKEGLKELKVKDIELAMKILNLDNVKLVDGKAIGLKEQVEPMRKDRDYLFEKEINGTGTFSTGSQTQQEPTVTNFATELGKQKAEALKAKSLTDFAK